MNETATYITHHHHHHHPPDHENGHTHIQVKPVRLQFLDKA